MLTIRQLFLYLLATISINVQAQVIIDTGTSNSNVAALIYEKSNNDFQKVAGKFLLQSNYTITDIFGSIDYSGLDGRSDAVINVSIHNNHNNEPGESLFSGQFSIPANPPINLGPPDQIYVPSTVEWKGLSNISLSLNSGSYWVVFSGVQGEPTDVGWAFVNATNPLPAYMVMYSSYDPYFPAFIWNQLSSVTAGLKILGTPLSVPEPDSLVMLLVGVGLLGFASRHNQ